MGMKHVFDGLINILNTAKERNQEASPLQEEISIETSKI